MPDDDDPAGDNPVDSVDKSMFEVSGSPSRTPSEPQRGVDIARAALESARAAGPRPDDRDPQPLGRLASRLVADRGWADRVSAGVVFARWPQLVGADVAGHSEPVSLHDGELLVRATSTAWATQLRLLQRQLLARIAAGVGPNVVTRLRIQGPTAPTWVHGHRHVRGRGPRDTYG
jgi:predicted nucleic acid-binding Zn ribbon protein